MIKKILIMVVIALIWIILITLYGIYVSVRPHKFVSNTNPALFNLSYENVTLKTKDGLNLDAWFIPQNKSKKVIIVGHGYPFDKGDILPVALFLHKNYNLLFFDFRYLGRSEGKYSSGGFHERKDLQAAIDFLKKKGFKKIGGLGFSLSASVMIMENKKLDAIVADSAFASLDLVLQDMYRQFFFLKWPFVFFTKLVGKTVGLNPDKVSPINAIKNAKTPILLIHGEKDSQINVKNAKLLYNANNETELWLIPNADHGEAHYLRKEEYEKRVLDFLEKNLK